MINRYRGGVLPAVGERDSTDDAIAKATSRLPASLQLAYSGIELQQCALLPIELARAANGYIEATSPFKMAKDETKKARLDTVLNLSAQAVYRALVALLPIMPEKAAIGLSQFGVDVSGKTLDQLLAADLPAGHKLGQGQPLFPKIETKA
jgi:methionyl-tRNA synthetase